MPRLTSDRSVWILILAIALAARLFAAVWWNARVGERQFFFGDSEGYWELARSIATGGPYAYPTPEYRVFRTPGYPLVLSSVFLVFGDKPPPLAGRVLSAVLGTMAVGVVGWWTGQLFDASAARLAGWIAALYPGAIALGVFVLSEAPFCALMLLHLALWSAAWQAASRRRAIAWAVGGGAAAAAATMMRPSWLLFAPFALAIGLLFASQPKRQLVVGGAMCAALAVGMSPWWVRNALVTGRFVPTSLQVGASLYDGLHEGATGASDMSFVPEITAAERAAEVTSDDVFEYRLDRRFLGASLDWARHHPLRVVQLAGIKFLRMWNVWPNEPAFRSLLVRVAIFVTYAPLLVLGLLGAWRFTPRGWPYVLAWLPAVYLTLLHVIFVSSIRYREPAMLALVVLASGFLGETIAGRAKPPQVPAD
ncbi:MAG: hypothetical protein DWQ37_20885 [Planctomycetota bacterium]|nr:MAG: hypothetical protein DWQ37_20885 [Planctomycetota bacterium]